MDLAMTELTKYANVMTLYGFGTRGLAYGILLAPPAPLQEGKASNGPIYKDDVSLMDCLIDFKQILNDKNGKWVVRVNSMIHGHPVDKDSYVLTYSTGPPAWPNLADIHCLGFKSDESCLKSEDMLNLVTKLWSTI